MLKQLVKDSAIYSAAAMLGQGMSLILLPFYTRVLSPADYGVVDILSVFSTLVYLTIALEISQGFCRHYPDAQTESDRRGYASTALWFTVAIYTLFVCVGILLARPLATFVLDSSSDAPIMRLAILAVWGHGPFSLILLLFRFQMQAIKYAIVNLTVTVITITTTVFLVLYLQLGIKGVICGGLVGQTTGAILALLIARRDYRLAFSHAKLIEMLKFSIPLVPSSIGVFGAQYIDRIVVKELLSFADLGLFGIGYRMASPINLMMLAFASSLTPLIYTHYRQPETPGEIARIFRYFCALVLLIFTGLSLFAEEFLLVVTTPDYLGSAKVVPFLVMSTVLASLYLFTPGLAIVKKTKLIAVINVARALLTVILNVIFIPLLGILGAGLATTLSAALTFGINMLLSQKHYFIPHNWRILGLATLIAVGVVAIGTQLPSLSWAGILSKLMLTGITGGAFIWLGLVDLADVRKVWEMFKRRLCLAFPGVKL